MSQKTKGNQHIDTSGIIKIKIIPDESTLEAMKQFERDEFKKRIEKESKILSSHKLVIS